MMINGTARVVKPQVIQKFGDNYAEKNWRFHETRWKSPHDIRREHNAKSRVIEKIELQRQKLIVENKPPPKFQKMANSVDECGSD